jgi:hypothetical protein
MFLGALKKKRRLKGFFLNNCFEPKSLKTSHDEIVLEMLHRTYNHNTPLEQSEIDEAIQYLNDEERTWCIDREASLKMLLMKCPKCGSRFNHYEAFDEALDKMAENIANYIDNEIVQSIVENNTIT